MIKELSARRYSVRNYNGAAVSDAELNYVLECARLAPSAVNFQPWHFYVVKSEEAKMKLRECYDRSWFVTAPCYIVCAVCHDEEWVRVSDGKQHGNIDVAIAAEHICLAATELGLGTCWVCNFDVKKCSEVLDLPQNIEPAVIIPIGRPADNSRATEKVRKPANEIVTMI